MSYYITYYITYVTYVGESQAYQFVFLSKNSFSSEIVNRNLRPLTKRALSIAKGALVK